MLKKYGCHLNVEACTSTKPVSYPYKYIFKGSDSADLSTVVTPDAPNRRVNEARANRNDTNAPVDEVSIFHDARWIGSCEAAWRILGLPIGEIKPLHQQRLSINPEGDETPESLLASEKLRRTTLTEYFAVNLAAKEAEDVNQPVSLSV